tara:strand:+ start:485 stop:586 length:102 start_codon:yes stop_codon:yes gene_type:complete
MKHLLIIVEAVLVVVILVVTSWLVWATFERLVG